MVQVKHLVSSEWLFNQLDDPKIAIVDCRFRLAEPEWGYQQYLQDHIPGAYYFDLDRDLSAPVQKHGGRHPLPKPELIADRLAEIGIVKNETLVVVYDDNRLAFASRLWWLLRYLGHHQVVILDGGWSNWQRAKYPITSQFPTAKRGLFIPEINSNWLVDIQAIKSLEKSSQIVLIDSRENDRFSGIKEPIDPIAGHIPNAVNFPWQQVTNEAGFLRSFNEQKQLWTNYQQAKEIIVYCGSGVTACVNLFSLEIAGITNTKLYPGGWSDWCSYLL